MYPGLPSRLEKEIKQLHLTRLLNGDPTRLNVRYIFLTSLCYFPINDSTLYRNSRSRSRIPPVENTWSSLEVQYWRTS